MNRRNHLFALAKPSLKTKTFFKALLLFSFFMTVSPLVHAQKDTAGALTTRINHIAVYVYDLQKSRDFYENVVRLKWMANPFNDGLHEWFSIGAGAQLHLIKGATAITAHPKSAHLCFSVPSVENFIPNLKKYGVSYTNWPGEANAITIRPDGVKQIYFTDPDGYWIEINDDKG
jgi:lactoylglutathione lyase